MDSIKAKLPSGFVCHQSLVSGLKMVFGGLYEIELAPPPATILDIGANAGSFALWAMDRWPKAKITCFEPSTPTLKHLYMNVSPEKHGGRVEIIGRAVTTMPGPYVFLHDGAHNTGERSIYMSNDNTECGESVPVFHPKDLPPCELLKLDCEASEREILLNYPHLDKCRAVVMEYHRREELPDMILALGKAGLRISRVDNMECLVCFKRDGE